MKLLVLHERGISRVQSFFPLSTGNAPSCTHNMHGTHRLLRFFIEASGLAQSRIKHEHCSTPLNKQEEDGLDTCTLWYM